MASAEALGDGERKFVQELKTMAPTLSCAAELAKTFSHLMRTRDPAGFDLWLEQALSSELATFARGLRRDGDAVRAAFTEPWGTSPVEGQINRLKTKNRQMYGRANYPLLRSRVLDAA
jgi:transposase